MQDSGMSVCPTTWPYFLTHFLMAGKMGLIVACKKGFPREQGIIEKGVEKEKQCQVKE